MMTSILNEEIHPRGRYSATETSRLLGVNRSTLRRWKLRGILTPRLRPHNGRPVYLGQDLIDLFNKTRKYTRNSKTLAS